MDGFVGVSSANLQLDNEVDEDWLLLIKTIPLCDNHVVLNRLLKRCVDKSPPVCLGLVIFVCILVVFKTRISCANAV